MLRGVQKGEFILPTENLSFPYRHWDRFLAAGDKNAGKFHVNEMGDLIEKSTGKIPKYNIYGFPFPKIDPKDPMIADKIMWNFNFQKYRLMSSQYTARIVYLTKDGKEERVMAGEDYTLYFQCRPPGHVMKNTDNYLIMELQNNRVPMSLKGANTMAWHYWDERDITQFTYLPAIRRIRQTSGASRSDSYMGSDSWLDMNNMWQGKNRSMKWKLIGERTILAGFTSATKGILEEAPDGTITRDFKPVKYGYKIPGWKGAPWATPNLTYVPRQVWVIEQWPKDPYYNWGLHVIYVDKETYCMWFKEVYDKAGQFRVWRPLFTHYSETPDGNSNIGDNDGNVVVDEKVGHATVFYREGGYGKMHIFMPASKLGPKWFTEAKLLELSK